MKVYEVEVGSVDIDAISLIGDHEEPANGFMIKNKGFVALKKVGNNETYIKFSKDNKELKTVYGIVLRADQVIDRISEDGELYGMKFSADGIRQAALNWSKSKKTTNSNWNHEEMKAAEIETQGHFSWIVVDPNNDTASAIGLEVEVGDWVVGQKLSDSDWDEYIKSGRVKGYSIEAFLKYSDIKLKRVDQVLDDNSYTKNKKEKMSLKSFINLFSTQKVSKKISLASIEVDGETFLSDDDFAEGTLVYTLSEEGDVKNPVVEKTFEVDGFTVTTDVDGLISSKVEITQEEEVKEDLAELEEEEVKDEEVSMKKVKQSLAGEVGAFIELPVGEWTIGDNIYTVEEVTIPAEESWDGEEYTVRSIVKLVPVGGNETEEELKKVKAELAKVKSEFSQREVELGKLEVKKQEPVDLSKMTAKEKFRYFKNN